VNTTQSRPALIAFLAAACVALLPASTSATAGHTSEWRFNVLLDDKPIGYHRFELSTRGAERELRSDARFNVKVLFINAYTYTHTADEQWQGECLSRLEARTNDNGNKNHITGTRRDSSFVVANGTVTATLAPCVQTFAYWNPQILTATRLLNPQTSEYVPVRVTSMGLETIEVRGRPMSSERFRLTSEPTALIPLQIDLWYSSGDSSGNSENRQWLALESIAEGGGRLRYKLL
jgi:hypothetical protein